MWLAAMGLQSLPEGQHCSEVVSELGWYPAGLHWGGSSDSSTIISLLYSLLNSCCSELQPSGGLPCCPGWPVAFWDLSGIDQANAESPPALLYTLSLTSIAPELQMLLQYLLPVL